MFEISMGESGPETPPLSTLLMLTTYLTKFCFAICRLRSTELPVNVSNKFNCMLGKKSLMLRVEINPQTSTASFRKDNNGIVYIIPPNVAVHPFIKA